jgi:hypothetical protein
VLQYFEDFVRIGSSVVPARVVLQISK